MLLIETYLAPSEIHGIGVFAAAPVLPGDVIWIFEPTLDRIVYPCDLQRLPPHSVAFLESHAEFYPDRGVFVLSGDHDRFTNHADDPNTGHSCEGPHNPFTPVIATRRIAQGEEITCDYGVIRVKALGCRRPGAGA